MEEHKRCINDFNFCISLIKDYNAKVKSKHRIPIAFFENVSQVIKKLKMDWLQEPFIDFIKSISESLPKQDDYKFLNKIVDYTEYVTEACIKFSNSFCMLFSFCSDTSSEELKRMFFDNISKKQLNKVSAHLNLYTQYSNRISREINRTQNSRHYDSFIALPGFKYDINVEPVTNFRCKQEDHNLSLIHIKPEKFFTYETTLRVIAHEVGHHVGQTEELRRIRSKYYIQCLMCYIFSRTQLSNSLADNDAKRAEEYRSLEKLLTCLYENAEKLSEVEDLKSMSNAEIWYSDVEYYYYTLTTFKWSTDFFASLKKEKNIEKVNKICETLYDYFADPKELLSLFFSKNECSCEHIHEITSQSNIYGGDAYTEKIDKNCICELIIKPLIQYSNSIKTNSLTYLDSSNMFERRFFLLFRECYADLFMLLITSDVIQNPQEASDVYFKRMVLQGNRIKINGAFLKDCIDNRWNTERYGYLLRFYVMYKFLCEKSSNGSIDLPKGFETLKDLDKHIDTKLDDYHIRIVILYLHEATKILEPLIKSNDYFLELRRAFSFFLKNDSKEAVKILTDIHRECQ